MQQVLEHLGDVVVYGDDIMIYSKTADAHVSKLTAVLEEIKMGSLKLSAEVSGCTWPNNLFEA